MVRVFIMEASGPVYIPNLFASSNYSVDPQAATWKSLLVNMDPRQMAARREWLELSRKQIAEYAGIPLCAVDLLEVGNEVSEDVASAYERSLKKLEFRKVMENLP